jgi:hypothetical protein
MHPTEPRVIGPVDFNVVQERMNMKTIAYSILGCLAIASTCAAGDLRIVYSSAGLTKVEVSEEKQLHLAWHTGRLPFDKGDNSPMRQSLEAYDSHSSVIYLTKSELSEFEKWIEKNGILNLKSKYPEPEKKTYGSAFQSSLTVELDDKKYSIVLKPRPTFSLTPVQSLHSARWRPTRI